MINEHEFEEMHPDYWKFVQCKRCNIMCFRSKIVFDIEIEYQTLKLGKSYPVVINDKVALFKANKDDSTFKKDLLCITDEEMIIKDIIK